MNIDKLKLLGDTIRVDDNTVIIKTGNKVKLCNSAFGITKEYNEYSVLAEGLCLLYNRKRVTSTFTGKERDVYDLYFNSKLYRDLDIISTAFMIKDNVNDIKIQYVDSSDLGLFDKYISKIKVNDEFTMIEIKIDSIDVWRIIYNSEGKELYSFESGIATSGLKFSNKCFSFEAHRLWDYAEIKAMGKLKYKELSSGCDKLFGVIINRDGHCLKFNTAPKIVGNYFIVDNSLVEIQGDKVKYLKKAEDFGKNTLYPIAKSCVCVATDKVNDFSKLKGCTVINTNDMSEISNVTIRNFSKSKLNCLGLIGGDYIAILRLKDNKIFKIKEKYTIGHKGSKFNYKHDKNGNNFISIRVDSGKEYRYDGENLVKA